jgi:hypothetical protein
MSIGEIADNYHDAVSVSDFKKGCKDFFEIFSYMVLQKYLS